MSRRVILAKRPDLVLKLERYGLLPPCKPGGKYEGCAKKWAKEGTPPYDTPEAQALAERLPTGWEELTDLEFNQLLLQLEKKIGEKKKEKFDTPQIGSERIMRNMVKIAFIGITSVASMIETSGLGILPDEDQADKKLAMQLSFELILHLINGTNLLKIVFKEIAATLNTSSENQEMIAEILKLFAVLLAILAAAKKDRERLKALTRSFRSTIAEGVEKTERFVSEALANETISGKKAEEIGLLLSQVNIALEKDDFEGFYEAFKDALGLMEISKEMVVGDFDDIQKFAEKLRSAMTSGIKEETAAIANVSQAM
ncbi:putative uncharacterized protein [Waddlia chondrophila 2032/99]|uniref:Uncharacterized protein n=2 Tax=Waddlia chondrophila TaxID=71667 RepID=D6YSA8_WADCW|nr:hypothetical protein [Waddlia chondrophila]ADI38953.1 hypothetical protein wcw_1608 [Waddlia chondrophila WSU 86-1044]CCB92073.1 putative uncharacterized protein [Waddlia chondrophila 2032/99]